MIISLVNPFSIIACWCSLNLIVVNFLLLLVITICINIIHKKANKKFLLTCFALGIAVTLANYFRPLFSSCSDSDDYHSVYEILKGQRQNADIREY